MKKKNILIVTDYAAPYEGNFIMSLKKLEESIKEDGGNFYYLFPKKAKNIDWVSNLNNVLFLEEDILKNIRILNKLIKEKNIDIMYSHFCLPKTQLAIKISRILNRKIKLMQHFHNHYEIDSKIMKRIILNFIFCGDMNIGCSKSVMESLPFKNKCYVNNGIDFSRLEQYEKIKFNSNNNFNILMFGYPYKRKGVDLAIKVIQNLNNEKIVLNISMSKGVKELKQSIKNDFGIIPPFVNILSPRNDITSYYKAANLFISPSREEGLCYSPIEALYCEIPSICSNIPGHPLDIPELRIFEKENIEELSKEICKIIDKVPNTEISKKYVISNYNVDDWCNKIKKVLYEKIN